MNKILIILAIVMVVLLGIAIAYYLQLPLAVDLVEGAQAKVSELTGGGGIDAQTLLTGGSLASAGVTAVSAYNQFKGKISAQTSAVKETLQKTQALQQVEEIKTNLLTTKETLTSQLDEVTKIKESALAEAEATKTQFNQQADELKKAQETIDTLHETLRRNKLSPDEAIIKTVVL